MVYNKASMEDLNQLTELRVARGIIACALLLVIEKPLSPAFITGKTGTVLEVQRIKKIWEIMI